MSPPQPLSLTTLTRVSGQLGTNPASIYENKLGERFYLKMLESPMHARNEWIAAQLYKLAGAPVFDYLPCADSCHVATRWLKLDKKCIAHLSEAERKQAQHWLGVHAWTANWDAAGYNGDNQGAFKGTVLTLDVGGALCYRAHGDPKGKAFGTEVHELQTLRSDSNNPHAVKLFSGMSDDDIANAIGVVTELSDDAVRSTITDNGGSCKLADKMIARKADMISRLAAIYRTPSLPDG